ncbi:DsrE family protein [Psychroflexus salinarum]|uniref:DsrE family protein n=1 Tax=Psychroflexus salinarum TaxID=546024 RepID=A0ABW3GRG5_9FLAO
MKNTLIFTALLISVLSFSQTSKSLESFGPVYAIENADFKTNLNQEFKAVFDVASISESKESPNQKFVTLARYLRLHQDPNLENNSVKAALVVHGSAIFDLLTHEEYAKYHKQETLKNPNYNLLSVLSEHNIDIILCGQTSKHRSIDKSKLHPDVKIALSAMSALIQLQNKDYRLINF